jgi:ornithine cyclodeaminase/alanine dehydrogenase-like protein (mu-crystallin family)
VTSSKSPVIEAEWVEPHALVVAAGSNWHNKAEIPADLVARAQTVVVDQLAAAQLESGDLIAAHDAGKFDWSRAVELAAIVSGKWQRQPGPGITLFESHGLALWDLAAGRLVVEAAKERGLGDEVQLF